MQRGIENKKLLYLIDLLALIKKNLKQQKKKNCNKNYRSEFEKKENNVCVNQTPINLVN